MRVPDSLVVTSDKYEHILLLPVGKKNKRIRSFGHKQERSLLSRVNQIVKEVLQHVSPDDQEYFRVFTGGRLPIAIDRDETIYPYLWRPETFLWTRFNPANGLPLKKEQFYPNHIATQSNQQMQEHIQAVIYNYILCGQLAEKTEEEFVQQLPSLYTQIPLIQLYEAHKQELQALQALQKASFVFTLTSQEQVLFWRERYEVMMRPFRAVPLHELELQTKDVEVYIEYPEVRIEIPKYALTLTYHKQKEQLALTTTVDVALTAKRIQSVIRLFGELLEQNQWLLQRFKQIRLLQQSLHLYHIDLNRIRTLYRAVQEKSVSVVPVPDVLQLITRLEQATIPAPETSELLWLANCSIPDVTLLTKWEEFSLALQEELQQLSSVIEKLEEQLYNPSFENVFSISTETTEAILLFIQRAAPTMRALVSCLKGKVTRANRENGYIEDRAFGILSGKNEAEILAILEQLQQSELYIKYAGSLVLTKKGEYVLSLQK